MSDYNSGLTFDQMPTQERLETELKEVEDRIFCGASGGKVPHLPGFGPGGGAGGGGSSPAYKPKVRPKLFKLTPDGFVCGVEVTSW